ncbi:MAG: AAA family ATPase [Synechococcus sp.]|nr:AAA family ATPase [Synechococcus sp.]
MAPRPDREPPPWQASLSEALAEALPRLLAAPAEPLVQEAIGALTAALCRGEPSLPLAGVAPPGVSEALWPEAHRRALQASRLSRAADGPLVLQGDRLFWRRWQQRHQEVLAALLARAAGPPAAIGTAASGPAPPPPTDPGATAPAGLDPIQRQAVQAALEHPLVLLLGGPGTGKTSTVARLLEAWLQRHPGGRVQLAAPTGKAAARLRAASGGRVPCTTLHRLLESRTEGFGRDRHNPLELDLLVVDEVSMLDLELMQALLAALPDRCQLVLVGDPAQLPPIAPGSLLLALLDPALTEVLAPVRFELSTVYRNDGAIASVAAALRRQMGAAPTEAGADRPLGPLTGLQPLLTGLGPGDNLQWLEIPPGPLPVAVLQRLRARRRRLASLAERCWPDREEGWQELLAERDRLLVLAPQRRGRWGIEAIHRVLLPAGGSDSNAWPAGTPVLCCRNLPGLDLANGDLGILVERLVGATPQRRILFGHQTPVWHHPAQLSGALEPALALTVHKAQGSEAAEVILLLEQTDGLDPRLLYTGLTRARQQALLVTATATAAAVGPSAAGA